MLEESRGLWSKKSTLIEQDARKKKYTDNDVSSSHIGGFEGIQLSSEKASKKYQSKNPGTQISDVDLTDDWDDSKK
jgi:hypothetical protein